MSRTGGHFRIGALVKMVTDSPHTNGTIVGTSEDMVIIGCNGIDGGVVGFHFALQSTAFY